MGLLIYSSLFLVCQLQLFPEHAGDYLLTLFDVMRSSSSHILARASALCALTHLISFKNPSSRKFFIPLVSFLKQLLPVPYGVVPSLKVIAMDTVASDARMRTQNDSDDNQNEQDSVEAKRRLWASILPEDLSLLLSQKLDLPHQLSAEFRFLLLQAAIGLSRLICKQFHYHIEDFLAEARYEDDMSTEGQHDNMFDEHEDIDLRSDLIDEGVDADINSELVSLLPSIKQVFIEYIISPSRFKLASATQSCGHCQKLRDINTRLKLCASCKRQAYCSPECQRLHWPVHKQACKNWTDSRKYGKEAQEQDLVSEEELRLYDDLSIGFSDDKEGDEWDADPAHFPFRQERAVEKFLTHPQLFPDTQHTVNTLAARLVSERDGKCSTSYFLYFSVFLSHTWLYFCAVLGVGARVLQISRVLLHLAFGMSGMRRFLAAHDHQQHHQEGNHDEDNPASYSATDAPRHRLSYPEKVALSAIAR